MVDRIKQIAFREFSLSESEAGTPWNAIQTGNTDAYVVKTILSTQGVNTAEGAISATATVGLTSDFNNGKYASIGTIAQQNRVGMSGSQVVDSNSTLTVRPVAKDFKFSDTTVQVDTESQTQPRKSRKEVRGSVLDVVDVSTGADIDKTSVTFANQQKAYQGSSNAYSHNYTFYHTNVNGVHLKIIVATGSSSNSTFEIHNADTGVQYGYYQTSYGTPMFDGERYLYWWDENYARIHYYDTDETTSNLSAANTYGGNNNAFFYHGRIEFATALSGSNTSYDNHYVDLEVKDGKTYFFFLQGSQNCFWMVELPTTLTNYSPSANYGVKWVKLWNGASSSQSNNFGTNNYTMGYLNNVFGNGSQGTTRVTYDDEIKRWIAYYNVSGLGDTYVGTFTQADYDATPSGSYLRGADGTYNHGFGLCCLEDTEIATHLKIPATYISQSNGQGSITHSLIYQNLKPTGDNWYSNNASERYWIGRKQYLANADTTNSKQFHIYELDLPNEKGTDLTASISGNILNYYGRFVVTKSVPDATTIASRTYSSAPKLTVSISGVHEDRS